MRCYPPIFVDPDDIFVVEQPEIPCPTIDYIVSIRNDQTYAHCNIFLSREAMETLARVIGQALAVPMIEEAAA